MNRNILRWILAAVMILSLALTLSFPYSSSAELVAESGALPLSMKEGGMPWKEENWTFADEKKKEPLSYEDSTIKVTFEHGELAHRLPSGPYAGKSVKDETWVVRIKINHVSQLRTAFSRDNYTDSAAAPAAQIGKKKNAIVVMNGDFYKQSKDKGYTVRQGELIRAETNTPHNIIYDMLLIDSEGDFHAVYAATKEKIDAYVAENLTPEGRTILDTFNIGPVLVAYGEVQDVTQSQVAQYPGEGLFQWSTPIQRIAIVQTGHLEYAIVFVNGKGNRKSGVTMAEFAQFVAEQCPNAFLAYNLDGGGSANIAAHDKKLYDNSYLRDINDIIYFASAEGIEE